jgi:hypothetical protein
MRELEPLGGVSVPSFAEFWAWVKKSFTPDYQAEITSYLKDSVDMFDLENRMKALKRRGMI